MQCDDVRFALGHDEIDEVRKHLETCTGCREYQESLVRLSTALDSDSDESVGPGFDTRFFARLEQEKQGKERRGLLGWLLAGAATAAAGVAAVLIVRGGEEELGREEVELALHLDLMEDFELVRNLEDVEAFELLAQVEDLDPLLKQGG